MSDAVDYEALGVPKEGMPPSQLKLCRLSCLALAGVAAILGVFTWPFRSPQGKPFVSREASVALGSTTLPGEEEVVISWTHGSIRGLQSSAWGRRFRGIPYGQAGRFSNAKLIDDYPTEFDARRFGPTCMRAQARYREDVSEDCLHLNVYTPIFPPGFTGGAPVIVWFHGGSFTMGAGSDTHAEDVKELVVTRRMVVVTVNYRLGVFGFLGSERLRYASNDSVGNFGTLDQQTALKWVQRHIAHFGGLATHVTLLGWSAGAASISNHLVMETSAGLFKAAIMLSGGFTSWAADSMENNERFYEGILRSTGCSLSPDCWQEATKPCRCLLDLSSGELLDAQAALGIAWAPTVDGTTLKQHPMAALRDGNVLKGVPIIIGGAMQDTLRDIGSDATTEAFVEFAALPSSWGGLGLNAAQAQEAKRIYIDKASTPHGPGLERWSPAYWAARNAGADQSMLCVARRAALMWERASGSSAWWYVWGNQPSEPSKETPVPMSSDGKVRVRGCWPCPGATHGSDLPYLFERNSVNVDTYSMDLADVYQVFLRNLVFGNNPNEWKGLTMSYRDPDSEVSSLAWPPAHDAGMWFDAGGIAPKPTLKAEECAFWDSV